MAQRQVSVRLFIFSLGLLVSGAAARADVQSMQGPYRQLLQKTIEAQAGRSANLDQLLYPIPASALVENAHGDFAQTVANWNQQNSLQLESQVLQNLTVQLNQEPDSHLFNREELKRNPVTLIVVPGIFGEFIDPLAFNEVTGVQTSKWSQNFLQKVKSGLQTQGPCKTGTEAHCDYHFSLNSMSLKQDLVTVAALDQLLSVTSLDDSAGNPLIKVVVFKTPRMSLESMGSIEKIATIFNRRLQKYFNLMGTPERFAYVGYSRGTMLALEMEKQSQNPRAKALFVVGGVTLGSDLADPILTPGSPVNLQLAALRKLTDNLKLTNDLSFFEAGKTRLNNLSLWIQFIGDLAQIQGFSQLSVAQKFTAVKAAVDQQIQKGKNSDPRAMVQLAMSVATDYGLLEQEPSFPYISISGLSQEAYSLNVARFKKFVSEAYGAAVQLTTSERQKWWQQAKLPQNFAFYHFAATLADPKSTQPEEVQLAKNQWAAGPMAGADYLGLIENYRDLKKISGASMNDSQVATVKVIAWPEVIHQLNPNLNIQSHFLGLFACHHWALALPVVNVNKDKSTNPFPRAAFLESMGHIFADQKDSL